MGKTYKLSSGFEMPEIGFGTWQLKEGLPELLEEAVNNGITHIDTAARYDNEDIIGKWLSTKYIREKLFITTKLWNDSHDSVMKACKESMRKLGINYIDLYLVHFPVNLNGEFNIEKLWRDMEFLVEMNMVHSIGCSNFGIKNLKKILLFCKIKPVVLQIELHPYLQQEELCAFCNLNDIQIVSYSSLGSSGDDISLKDDPVIKEIAVKHSVHPCTILLSFCTTLGYCIIPRSSNIEHIKSNMKTITLDNEDLMKIKKLERGLRYNKVEMFGPNRFD